MTSSATSSPSSTNGPNSKGTQARRSKPRDKAKAYRGSSELMVAVQEIACMYDPFKLSKVELEKNKIIYPQMPSGSVADRFRELRTRLLSRSGGENKITLVTSVLPKSGASYIATNLAAAYAFEESKTALLIDCNIKSPSQHKTFYLDPALGLTDFLEQDIIGLEKIIYATGVPRLRLIPAGSVREAGSEYFTSIKMIALLDVLKRRYRDRHIFLDAPAVNAHADTRILAQHCDQVVLVVPYGKSQLPAIADAIEAIGEEKIAGMIVNQ